MCDIHAVIGAGFETVGICDFLFGHFAREFSALYAAVGGSEQRSGHLRICFWFEEDSAGWGESRALSQSGARRPAGQRTRGNGPGKAEGHLMANSEDSGRGRTLHQLVVSR